MSRDFGLQVPIVVEAGVKIHPLIFIGGYVAFTVGGASSAFDAAQGCDARATTRSCGASSFHIGAEVQIHFRPARRANPWVGYGIGYETASASASGGGTVQVGESFDGLEVARVSGGVDFRLSRFIGVGPFLELDLGTYSHEHIQATSQSFDGSIPNAALHEWFTVGLRGVLFP
jgi:hypothetical protein